MTFNLNILRKHRKKISILSVFCVSIFSIIGLISLFFSTSNQESIALGTDFAGIKANNPNPPIVWDTDIILVNLGEVDLKNQTFWANFVVVVTTQDPRENFLEKRPVLSFMNSKSTTFADEQIRKDYYEVTVRGIFFSNFYLRRFPFNKLSLKVFIEPQTPNTAEKVLLRASKNQLIIDGLFSIPGWKLARTQLSDYVHQYGLDIRFSRVVNIFELEKSFMGVFLKTFFPVTMIVFISFLSFFIRENYGVKIYLTALLIYPLVHLHLSVIREIPDTSYLTYFDKIMVVYYSLFFNATLNAIRQIAADFHNKTWAEVSVINKQHFYAVPVIIGTISILLFLFS